MKKIFLAGHQGMVGNSIYRKLLQKSDVEIITYSRKKLDLRDQEKTKKLIKKEKPDIVILAAAKVGGIYANDIYPAEFIYDNIMIQTNVIHGAFESEVEQLLFLGSSCIYPKHANQPITEDALLSGLLEPTNEPYAIAKISGIKLCESYNKQYGLDYRSLMPTNLYGQGDNFHDENSHVIPALIRRFHEASLQQKNEVTLWGTGNAKRDFLHVDDLAEAVLFVLDIPKSHFNKVLNKTNSHINVGSGFEISISDLAKIISSIVGFSGNIKKDLTKPDGTPRKLLDISLLKNLGWKPNINLQAGLKETYKWFNDNIDKFRK